MKKLLLLGALLATTAAQAQTTYYWPGERVSELTDGTQYFIYNTAFDNGDRTNFLYSDGSTLLTTKVKPNSLLTDQSSYLFTTVKPNPAQSDNHWYLHSIHGIVGIGGQTNNKEIRDLYITPWTNESPISKANVKSEAADLTTSDDPTTTTVWTITKTGEANPNANSNTNDGYAWNGNPGNWGTWCTAHPYAFYTVNSKTLTPGASETYEEGISPDGSLFDLSYQLQSIYGLVQDGSKFYSNYLQSGEGSYEALIDNNSTNYFHSSWGAPGTDSDPAHYLRADLTTAVKSFYFIYERRTSATNDFPTSILIEGSNDDQTYTPITTISEGLPTNTDNCYFYFSNQIESETAYRYIKFTPQTTTTNRRYFHMGSLFILPDNNNIATALTAMNAVKSAVALKLTDPAFPEKDETAQLSAAETVINDLTRYINISVNNGQGTQVEESQYMININTANKYSFDLPSYEYRKYSGIEVTGAEYTIEGNTVTLNNFTDQNVRVAISFADDLPFTVSTSYADATWYQMKIRNSYYWTLSNDLTQVNVTSTSNDNPFDAKQLWCITGNLDDGFKIQNKAAGSDKYLTYGSNNPAIGEDANNLWTLAKTTATDAAYDGAFCFAKKGTTNYLNQSGNTLIYYGFKDGGSSCFTITKTADELTNIKTPIVNNYSTIINTASENQNRIGSLNAEAVSTLESALNAFNENPNSDTYSAFETVYNQTEGKTLDVNKYYRIKNVPNNIYMGLRNTGFLVNEDYDAKNGNLLVKFEPTDNGTYNIKMQNEYVGDIKATSNEIGFEGRNITIGEETMTFEKGSYELANKNFIQISLKNTNAKNGSQYCYVHRGGTGIVAWDSNAEASWWYIEEADTYDLEITSAGYATANLPFAVTLPEDLKAYIGSTISDGVIELTEIEGTIPSGTPVVLQGEAKVYTLNIVEDVPEITNTLSGTYLPQTIDGLTEAYVLANQNSQIGFYKIGSADRTVDKNKAYLTTTAAAGIKAFTFNLDGGTTGIENTEAAVETAEEYYDLQGRRVLNPTKGIYVTKSGKKVLFTK